MLATCSILGTRLARPRKTGLDYFSHDVDLSSDDKIEAMEGKYGPTGYAFYCKTLERIYRHGTPISYPGVFRSIMSGKLRITPGELDAMIDFAVEIALLSREPDGAIMSAGAEKRLNYIDEARKFDRNRVIQRKTTGKLPENPIKESKVKEIKEEKIKKVAPLPADPLFLNPLFCAAWDSWEETRKGKKKLTDHARALNLAKLKDLSGDDVGLSIQIINQTIMNSWAGFFPLKEGKNGINGKHPQQFKSAHERKEDRWRDALGLKPAGGDPAATDGVLSGLPPGCFLTGNPGNGNRSGHEGLGRDSNA